MAREKASDFDQELLNLFDQYVHGAIDRRGFLKLTGSGLLVALCRGLCRP